MVVKGSKSCPCAKRLEYASFASLLGWTLSVDLLGRVGRESRVVMPICSALPIISLLSFIFGIIKERGRRLVPPKILVLDDDDPFLGLVSLEALPPRLGAPVQLGERFEA